MIERFAKPILEVFSWVIGVWIILTAFIPVVIGLAPDDGAFPIRSFITPIALALVAAMILFVFRDQLRALGSPPTAGG